MKPPTPELEIRWFDGRLVGRLVNPGAIYFAYDAEWLRTGCSLSPLTVEFSDTAQRFPDEDFDHLPGFLADSLPDDWGRRLMERDFNAIGERPTSLRMLAWVDSRGIGALQYRPPITDEISNTWEKATPLLLAREAEAVLRAAPSQAFEHLRKGGTAGGALPKATVARLPDGAFLVGGNVAAAVAQHPDAELGILKLDVARPADTRSTDGRVEHAFMTLAAQSGIRTARTHLVQELVDGSTRHHLFVVRFDYEPLTGHRLHMLTLAGALQRFRLTYNDLLLSTRALTNDHQEVAEAVRRMLFNVRSGNADDHGKNHSFCFDSRTGQWRMSPAYDITFNAAPGRDYDGLSRQSFGETPRLQVLADVAANAGVHREEFERIDADVTAAVATWPATARQFGISDDQITHIASVQSAIGEALARTASGKERKNRRRKIWE